MKNLLRSLFGPFEYKFKIQLFKSGETFDTTYYKTITAPSLTDAKKIMLKDFEFDNDSYTISFQDIPGYTQMTVIEKYPPAVSQN